jgi:hypothetical protein
MKSQIKFFIKQSLPLILYEYFLPLDFLKQEIFKDFLISKL